MANKPKVEQLELFPEIRPVLKPVAPGRCIVCHRPIRHGMFGSACFSKTMAQIEGHKKAIEESKRALVS